MRLSSRNETFGSIREARRAGMQAAAMPTIRMENSTTTHVEISLGMNSTRRLWK